VPYPGGKNGAGVFQTIINLIPPHQVYIEPFLGGGAILRLKRPAALSIGLDLDSAVIARFRAAGSQRQKRRWAPGPIATSDDAVRIASSSDGRDRASHFLASKAEGKREVFRFLKKDALEFLASYPFKGDELVYCDPPYMHETRTRTDLYRFEMSDAEHARLLVILCQLRCRVMISGYWTKLYARALRSWNRRSYQAVTRSGRVATEWLWFNFPEPVALHDYRYLGSNFRDRERIKRKKLRWANRLQKMPVLERRMLLAALVEIT
jgi:DNA adenine methylase